MNNICLKNASLMRELITVSLPLMGGMAGNLLMMLVDRICLARYSEQTLAASGPAVFTAMAIITLFTATASISRSYIAQAFGKNGIESAMYEAFIGFIVAVLLSIILLASFPFIGLIPYLSNRPVEIVALESDFLRLSTLFGALMIINIPLSSFFNGIGNTRQTLKIGIVGQLISVVSIYGLVFGKFGLPEMGMQGSAIGTFFGTFAMTICYLYLMPKGFVKNGISKLKEKNLKANFNILKERLFVGVSIGWASSLDEIGNTAFVWIAAILGAGALAANNICLTLNYVAIIPIIGLGIGCSILCGNEVGRNNYGRISSIIKATMLIEVIYISVISTVQILIPDLLVSMFGSPNENGETMRIAASTTQVLWTYSIAFMLSMTGASTLECFGLTRYILIVRVVFMWLISIPIIYCVAQSNGSGSELLPIIWIIGSVFEFIIGVIYLLKIANATKKQTNNLVLSYA
ncbi:MATE family efflux transporter [Chitinibacter sp. ZOR0017]|uniref:MATE family efflux transporter n=1 Tax=Chitinibacter sp. ZOR0017 TaxID=1339254 RepID=UPI000647D646|nr:MATE family efflux transporter [Chitinibacter sp. ZOR0017]